ncbi:MAG: phosphate acyltransferase PlsX [bacterium]|nr:phosphate acyltransferase PlsX [bacterium]
MTDLHLPVTKSSLPVSLDAMGGDFGSRIAVEGAVLAAQELGIEVILVGNKSEIESHLKALGASKEPRLMIHHTDELIEMQESPASALRRKPNSSIHKAFELMHEGRVSSVVSAGNTGAFMAVGMKILGTVPGVVRPPIASLLPNADDNGPSVLLDAGANVDCNAHQLVQFAIMGSYYAASILGLESPRVALLSNGSEAVKGTDVIRSAAAVLNEIKKLNYIGYVEGSDIGRSKSDVIVCDGFAGNVLLKAIEGAVDLVFDSINHQIEKSSRGKLGLWLAKPVIKSVFKEKLDPSSYGGAPLLGLNGVSIICHGAASARGIMNGIRVAKKLANDELVTKIASALGDLEAAQSAGYQDGIWGRMGKRFDRNKKESQDSDS